MWSPYQYQMELLTRHNRFFHVCDKVEPSKYLLLVVVIIAAAARIQRLVELEHIVVPRYLVHAPNLRHEGKPHELKIKS
jgi:hypothetical protein